MVKLMWSKQIKYLYKLKKAIFLNRYSFDLDPACKNNAEVQAPDTTGTILVKPKSAVL